MDKMTINKAELLNRLEELQKQQEGISAEIQDLSGMIQNLPDEPEKDYLEFENNKKCWLVSVHGYIFNPVFLNVDSKLCRLQKQHRLFKSERMAKLFAEKTQFIADCLFWKEMYDRDYVPDWDEMGWIVFFNHYCGEYEVVGYKGWEFANVCFSSEEIAKGLANWLNKKNGLIP